MPPYTLPHHLLDRTHINDTISKLYLLTDLQLWARLSRSEVFAPRFIMDYTSMWPGEPQDSTPEQAVGMFRPIMEKMSATQHVLTGALIEGLRVPLASEGEAERGNEQWPQKAKVTAYVTVHLVQKGAVGGKHTSNGGIGELEVVRLAREECVRLYGDEWDGNPWRVSLFRPRVLWYQGNYGGILGVKLEGEE